MKTTFEEYKKAILKRYDVNKNEENSHYLLDPTPGNLKRLASELCAKNSVSDQSVFDSFFGFKEDVIKAKAILNFETDKFRPLSKFLNGKSNLQEIPSANLLAILVDFENRPFLKFKKNQFEDKTEEIISEEILIKDPSNQYASEKIKLQEKNTQVEIQTLTSYPKKPFFSTPMIVVCITLFIALSAFSLHKTFEKKCMIWKDDHYEKIDCENTTNGFANYATVLPLDPDLIDDFKKIKISDTTRFFINGKPAVWYLKQNNRCEFFNAPGFHPVNKKTLKEITPHIIRVHASEQR